MSCNPEKAFDLINEGNSFQKEKQWWNAAESYGGAMRILKDLAADEKVEGEGSSAEPGNGSKEEQQMIRKLYEAKRNEYLDRARNCFLKALTNEDNQDQTRRKSEQTDGIEPLCTTLSEETLEKRLHIFANLYAKNEIVSVGAMPSTSDGMHDGGEETNKGEVESLPPEDMEDKEKTLEDRLRDLNDSLPSELKTSKQRMVDIDKGLRRLGLSFYTKDEKEQVEQELDEDEQIDQILNQAKDEVLFERTLPSTTDGKKSKKGQAESDDDDDDDDGDVYDAFEDRVVLIGERKAAKEKIEEAQVKLAEFMALINSKPDDSSENDENDSKSDNSTDMDIEQEIQMLLKAKRCIQKALSVWSD
eukprot:CAMPEP_0195295712 /NCGR_PEP_ID=MMETSP0707-20130614/17910_1 /TAXON_ID=33640 /ORGANISM="Asterionellopsis glacialis, Strain CCMP134" /LENGTH=359 /DNA_ID=CAMNT_0040356997 /DNA_START=27 /DNA_END=1106 /DNA_ORIENTATION=-